MNSSVALVAVRILAHVGSNRPSGLLVVVDGDHRAEALARLMGQLDPERTCACLPAWDCLPYDHAAPSADIMGQRMRLLHDLPADAILVVTPEALLQRLPPREAVSGRPTVRVGARLDVATFGAVCARLGYEHADRVEDPGQVAVRGEVIDIFPASVRPFRITVLDGVVRAIHTYDPVTQRSTRETTKLRIDAVSEVIERPDEAVERVPGIEHWLPHFYPATTTVPALLPDAPILIEPQAEARIAQLQALVAEAYRDRVAADRADPGVLKALPPDRLYLTPDEWAGVSAPRRMAFPAFDDAEPVPRFCLEDKPGQAFLAFAAERRAAGHRIVLAGSRERDLVILAREAERASGPAPVRIDRWSALKQAAPDAILLMRLSADHGFADAAARVTLVTAADLLGHHARASSYRAVPQPWHVGDGEFAVGDLVIHTEHGVGVLQGLETLESGAAQGRDTVRIDYAKGTDLLVPVGELDRIWRYGAAQEGVALDRLDVDAWDKRRAKIAREVAETARALVVLASQRDATKAPVLVPPRRDYEAFVEGFAYAPTPDQIHAIDDCLKDLASGRPMDRLVVGDVGFGKTEVALRAAAAAVMAGAQVALIAPTTVLVRQHVQSFTARFAAFGIEVAQLSRLVPGAEADRVRAGLADGSVRLVVGTHALAGKGVGFAELGLLIVDEEQRFGAADKARIRALGAGVHSLTLTATPIPRTLQSALVGLQDLSVIATPPARRRPIRTLVEPFDPATVRTALLREKGRGGQSFVVVPRIEDLTPLAAQLKALMPGFAIEIGHGQMEAHEVDAAMMRFASGQGDVLLATSIIESGLDVPRANTMVVCGAERFGLAQLHQLRGRVGRGRQQGVCYLMTEAGHALAPATERRLATLAMLDRLGSGMAISAQDLDARGAGDLMGEDQAGHMRLIGLGLYQYLLQAAIRQARGEAVDDWAPEIHLGQRGFLPPDYIPEAEVRLNLYARMARAADQHDVDQLAEEIEDRFGPLPDPVADLLAQGRLKALCRRHAVARVDAGPKAIALTPRRGREPKALLQAAPAALREALSVKQGRLVLEGASSTVREQVDLVAKLLGEA